MRRPRPRRGHAALVGVLVLLALPAAAVSPADGAPPAVRFGSGGRLTAGTATLAGLSYAGTVTVTTAAGDMPVLELATRAATLTGLTVDVACTPVPGLGTGLAATISTPAGSTTSAPGGLTLYATSLTATASGAPIAWSPAAPPPAAQLGDVTVSGLGVDFVGIAAPTLSAPGLSQATRFCTP